MSTSKRSTAQSREAIKAEKLNAPVNMNGVGEDPAVQDLLSDKFVKGTNAEATEIAMALRQIISGQSLLLQNQERQAEEIAKVRTRMAEMDSAAEKWEKDKTAFLQEVADKADRIRTSNPDRIIANGALEFQNALVQAKAEQAVDKMKFKEMLNRMPKETVISPGELVTVMESGQQVSKLYPEMVSIKGYKFVFQPGVPQEVPKAVADALRNRRASQRENAVREELLSKNLEQPKLQQKWAEINSEYKSPTGA
jgi:hypothetical protein